jgi:hypothetical protein
MATITINGRKFVETSEEFAATLFQPDGTATGFFKVRKRDILLFDHQNEPMAVVNRELVLGKATKAKGGKIWYSYMPFNHFLYQESRIKERDQLEKLTAGRDHLGYFFK